MLDLHKILQDSTEFVEMMKKRGMEYESALKLIQENSEKKKSLQVELETLRSEKNRISKEIGIRKSKGEDISAISDSIKDNGDKMKFLEDEIAKLDESLESTNYGFPNLLSKDVPIGKDEHDNVLVREVGKKPEFSFKPKAHFEIGESMKIFDFERGVKMSGARFYTYFGLGAKLERALMNFMLDVHTSENGYLEVMVPSLVNDESLKTTGQLPKFRDEFYHIATDGLNLIPTAEVPVTNLHRDEILPEKELPISYVAFTSCYRREAGSYGRDTRGLVRVHQFQKIEMVKFSRAEESDAEHQKMLSHAESILQKLELPYRVMLLCSKDISAASSKTYDLEVWMPGLGRFMEISSVSNFLEFQSRRGKIRYKNKEGKNVLVHTLNGSGLALGRTMAAILENFQTSDGTFTIPKVLERYL